MGLTKSSIVMMLITPFLGSMKIRTQCTLEEKEKDTCINKWHESFFPILSSKRHEKSEFRKKDKH